MTVGKAKKVPAFMFSQHTQHGRTVFSNGNTSQNHTEGETTLNIQNKCWVAESAATMDSSDEDEFHDANDAAIEPHGEEKSPEAATPDHVPSWEDVKVLHVGKDIASVSLTPADPTACGKLHLECPSSSDRNTLLTEDTGSVLMRYLHPGTEYLLCLTRRADDGSQNEAFCLSFITEPAPPEKISVCHVSSESVTVEWDAPAAEVHSYLTTCSCEGDIMEKEVLGSNSVTFGGLRPGVNCDIEVCAKLKNGSKSKPATVLAKTKTIMENLLADMGLEQYYPAKLSLGEVLQIDEKTVTDQHVKCNADRPWHFLKKLMMVNVTGRNVKYASASESNFDAKSENQMVLDLRTLANNPNEDDMLNPVDIITALFLCADSFVQQEMALKLSMCQFSVPLLLPNPDTNQCTFMLWAMRDIVKKYRPQSLSESKGFVEDRIVLSELPLISFVRLGECSLSKSEILNKLLCNSQQYHDTFVHHDMDCGDCPRRISDGLTEITWYLPCGNKNMDIFNEPIAIANLRGDISSFETQYSFLCQTSAAVFVFFDNMDLECQLLTNQNHGAQIFLVGNHQNKDFNLDAVQKIAAELGLNNNSIILKTKRLNNADLVESLRRTVRDVAQNPPKKITIEQMAEIAHEVGIAVDEDSPECQRAKKNADNITNEIQDNLKYKETHLPLQGQIWKELTGLEKEEFRLQKVGAKDVEMYKSDLRDQKKKLRETQNSGSLSHAMIYFISAISSPGSERCYFLKWMRMNLDNLSREKLTYLREQYKKKCENSENKEEIKELDIQLSNSSLGTEHFFREISQIYEASVALSETHPSCQQFAHLPKLCAELLLDGFPLELVDGDASNIPLRWVKDVLSQLNDMVAPKNKILVVTVLGVQSTGKSTLLNTMFGVQFSVSSGRCTRGAFMLLIRVNEDVKKILNCDYMVIIDTEGLKSPELAQLDDSHEHDNELATLVVGLSDVTIINIAMENITEMKDILQIVVHAFLRMKEIGKKHKCQFVHQNVSDVSAHEKNLRDRKLLLQQLNEMTLAAAKMEKKEENKSFTDVMEYNPDTGNWYVPGLWNGNPPMAPVNAGYSEAVYELKKTIIQMLGNSASSSNNILEFTEWMSSLWNAVKNENFIFSFRNSLVADAYTRLCTEFNKWEWDFKKDMYSWVTKAETRISNVGTAAEQSEASDVSNLLTSLKAEAFTELSRWETKLLDNLANYFKQTEGHVYLVERYKEDFTNRAKSLRRELENSIINQLTAAAEIKQGMSKVDNIKKNHTKVLEDRVCTLIEECHKKKQNMTDTELDGEFDQMWAQIVKELNYPKQKVTNIFNSTFHILRANVKHKGSASRLLNKINLQECGLEPFTYDHGCWVDLKHKMAQLVNFESHKMAVQKMTDSIVACCKQFVHEKVERRSNYHNNYTEELLKMIDDKLQNNTELKTGVDFEVSLKVHICGDAARHFQKMHEDFIRMNDPHCCLNQNKDKFCADFKDVFNKRDQCQKKAQEFTNLCLRPAVEEFVNCSLGLDIIGEMKTQKQFSARMCFQEALVKDLHSKDTFESYLSYISSYEEYVKKWILDQIHEHFTKNCDVSKFEDQHIHSCISSINTAIEKAKTRESGNLKTFVEDVCEELEDKLKLRQDVIDAFMILNNANHEQFAKSLTAAVTEMGKSLQEKFQVINIETKLGNLSIKPQNELFTELIGCGKQCPFCKAPCDAGGQKHTEHFAKLHRPNGLGRYRFEDSEKLVTDICSSLVVTDRKFKCFQTKGEYHPYKQYKDIFPDWSIPADATHEALDFWKYVLAKFNKKFAKEYHAKPADIPPGWETISHDQAGASIKISFNT